MPDFETVLPVSPDDAIARLRSAVAALMVTEQARAQAEGEVREAVMAARAMRVPWDAIGKELGVSRQAATERYGGEVRAQLVAAWHRVEMLLRDVAKARAYPGRHVDLLRQLGQEGALSAEIVADAIRLYQARSAAVHGAGSEVSLAEAERLIDVAIPLAGTLWLLSHADTLGNESMKLTDGHLWLG